MIPEMGKPVKPEYNVEYDLSSWDQSLNAEARR
jgi:hypothetical protein